MEAVRQQVAAGGRVKPANNFYAASVGFDFVPEADACNLRSLVCIAAWEVTNVSAALRCESEPREQRPAETFSCSWLSTTKCGQLMGCCEAVVELNRECCMRPQIL